MKKIFLIIALALMATSCATFYPQQKSTHATFLDYRPYTSEGFFVSPNPYTGEHETIGELYIEVKPEQKEINESERNKYDAPMYWGTQLYGFERINHAFLLEEAVKRAVKMGANGIVNLNITKVSRIGESIFGSSITYEIQGLCIKIEK